MWKESCVKTAVWRTVSTGITLLITFLIFDKIAKAAEVAAIDAAVKFVVYFCFDWLWTVHCRRWQGRETVTQEVNNKV